MKSRFDGSKGVASIDSFVAAAHKCGFKLQGAVDETNKMFFTLRLVKAKGVRVQEKVEEEVL